MLWQIGYGCTVLSTDKAHSILVLFDNLVVLTHFSEGVNDDTSHQVLE
jgi:hypothetical protein